MSALQAMAPDTADDMREALQSAERAARDQQFNIGHAAALLVLLAQAGPSTEADAEMARRWLHVEYLAEAIAGHVAGLTVALDGVEAALSRIGRGAP